MTRLGGAIGGCGWAWCLDSVIEHLQKPSPWGLPEVPGGPRCWGCTPLQSAYEVLMRRAGAVPAPGPQDASAVYPAPFSSAVFWPARAPGQHPLWWAMRSIHPRTLQRPSSPAREQWGPFALQGSALSWGRGCLVCPCRCSLFLALCDNCFPLLTCCLQWSVRPAGSSLPTVPCLQEPS